MNDFLATSVSIAAARFLEALTPDERLVAVRAMDERQLCTISYRPHPRPGLCLGSLGRQARKQAFRMLAAVVSRHTFAQITTVMGLEEVVDSMAGWSKDQHSTDYWVVLYGQPGGAERWGWRLEGHHVSITVVVRGARVVATPLFLGANPDHISHGGCSLIQPFAAESRLAFSLLRALSGDARRAAIVSDTAPRDITFGSASHVEPSEPLGVRIDLLTMLGRGLLLRLVSTYVDRFVPELRERCRAGIEESSLHFAWMGGARPLDEVYYRIQAGGGLLIEYANNRHGNEVANHSHTVIRAPDSDFGRGL